MFIYFKDSETIYVENIFSTKFLAFLYVQFMYTFCICSYAFGNIVDVGCRKLNDWLNLMINVCFDSYLFSFISSCLLLNKKVCKRNRKEKENIRHVFKEFCIFMNKKNMRIRLYRSFLSHLSLKMEWWAHLWDTCGKICYKSISILLAFLGSIWGHPKFIHM